MQHSQEQHMMDMHRQMESVRNQGHDPQQAERMARLQDENKKLQEQAV